MCVPGAFLGPGIHLQVSISLFHGIFIRIPAPAGFSQAFADSKLKFN